MMVLYVFNPEHDLALSANLSNFTSPRAGRMVRARFGHLPALWAVESGYVLVDDVEEAEHRYQELRSLPFGRFLTKDQLCRYHFDAVDVWGWDRAIRAFLLRHGVDPSIMPTDEELDVIRELSHRRHAAELLSLLQVPGTTGCAFEVGNIAGIQQKLDEFGQIVIKAPWSSSGRGVRFVEGQLSDNLMGWLHNIISTQGSVMVEPYYYNKVKDFGMEFESDGKGTVTYLGLSLFETNNGAYIRNVVASEEEKLKAISRYVSVELLHQVQSRICSLLGAAYQDKYKGPLGIDMMIVASPDGNGYLLHPCVEINLRRTMGHVALAMSAP